MRGKVQRSGKTGQTCLLTKKKEITTTKSGNSKKKKRCITLLVAIVAGTTLKTWSKKHKTPSKSMSAGNDISHLQSLDLRLYKYLLQKSKSATRFTSDLKQHVSPIYMGVFHLLTYFSTYFILRWHWLLVLISLCIYLSSVITKWFRLVLNHKLGVVMSTFFPNQRTTDCHPSYSSWNALHMKQNSFIWRALYCNGFSKQQC